MVAVAHRSFVTAWIVGALLVTSGRAGAQISPAQASPRPAAPATEDPVLQALLADALSRSPELHAAQSAIDAARLRTDAARARPDPMVALTYTNDGWAPTLGSMPMTTLGFMVSQTLPYSGKRQLRADLAASEARQAEPALARARLAIEAAVTRAYAGLLQARELQSLTVEQRALWSEIEVVTRARYAVGQGAQQDVLRVQVEVTRVEQRAIEQAAEIELRVAELNRLAARPMDRPIETSARLVLQPLAGTVADAIERARGVNPELESVRRMVQTEQAALALARREFKPDITIQGGYMNRGGLDAMWQAGVGINLPINKTVRQAAVADAEVRTKGGAHALEAIELQLRYRTQERFTRARAAEKIIDLYDDGIVPQDRMTVESAVANYQSGKVPFVSVLEAMTALYADRWTRVGLVADHARLRASLAEASLDATPDMTTAPGGIVAFSGSGQPSGMGGGMGGR
jgi:outer membrane protein, heavy metal efflux system